MAFAVRAVLLIMVTRVKGPAMVSLKVDEVAVCIQGEHLRNLNAIADALGQTIEATIAEYIEMLDSQLEEEEA